MRLPSKGRTIRRPTAILLVERGTTLGSSQWGYTSVHRRFGPGVGVLISGKVVTVLWLNYVSFLVQDRLHLSRCEARRPDVWMPTVDIAGLLDVDSGVGASGEEE
jgi:hypothetical protein